MSSILFIIVYLQLSILSVSHPWLFLYVILDVNKLRLSSSQYIHACISSISRSFHQVILRNSLQPTQNYPKLCIETGCKKLWRKAKKIRLSFIFPDQWELDQKFSLAELVFYETSVSLRVPLKSPVRYCCDGPRGFRGTSWCLETLITRTAMRLNAVAFSSLATKQISTNMNTSLVT